MKREPGSRWRDWIYWVALTGGLTIGGFLGALITGAFFSAAGFAAQLAVWSTVELACAYAAILVTAARLRRVNQGE